MSYLWRPVKFIVNLWWAECTTASSKQSAVLLRFIPLSIMLPTEKTYLLFNISRNKDNKETSRLQCSFRKASRAVRLAWGKCNMKLCFIVGATQLVWGHDAQGEGGYVFPHAEALLGPFNLRWCSLCASHQWLNLNSGPAQKWFLNGVLQSLHWDF